MNFRLDPSNLSVHTSPDALRLSGLRTKTMDDTSFEDSVFYHAESTGSRPDCPDAANHGPLPIHKHGSLPQKIHDITSFGKRVIITIDRQRFKCGCGQTFMQPIAPLHPNRLMTQRLADYIAKRSFESTHTDIAHEVGVDDKTVLDIFDEYIAKVDRNQSRNTPRILGIDEIHLPEARCVLTDIAERSLFDMLPARAKICLNDYLEKLSDKHVVEVVVADMWRPYHALAAVHFPKASVVVDKFHVIRMASKGMDQVRLRCGRSRTHVQKLALKDDRFLLFKRAHDLTIEEDDRLKAWFKVFPKLKAAYVFKEAFFRIYDEPDRRSAERALQACVRRLPCDLDPFFEDVLRGVNNWKDPILNYFDNRYTNGYTEGLNAKIRLWEQVGRGYSFPRLRAKMLYQGPKRPKLASIRSRNPNYDGMAMMTDVPGTYRCMAPQPDARRLGPDLDLLTAWMLRWPPTAS